MPNNYVEGSYVPSWFGAAFRPGKTRQFLTDEEIRRAKATQQSEADIAENLRLKRERELQDSLYHKALNLPEVTALAPTEQFGAAERKANEQLFDIKANQPLATSAIAELSRRTAEAGYGNVAPLAEAEKTGAINRTATNKYEAGLTGLKNIADAANAFNATNRAATASGNLGYQTNTARLGSAPAAAIAEDAAAEQKAKLNQLQYSSAIPNVAQSAAATAAEDQARLLAAQNMAFELNAPPVASDLEQAREAKRAELAAQITRNRFLAEHPEFGPQTRIPNIQEMLPYGTGGVSGLDMITSALRSMQQNRRGLPGLGGGPITPSAQGTLPIGGSENPLRLKPLNRRIGE